MEIDPLDEHPGTEHNTHPATTPPGTHVHSDHHGEGVVISSDEYYLVVEFAHGPETMSPYGLTVIDAPAPAEGGMAPAPTQSDYERRGRRAKAQALATVLADLKSVETTDDVDLLDPEDWAVAAHEATRRGLLGRTTSGKVRNVNPPGSTSGDARLTIDAVRVALGPVLAERTPRNRSEAVHGAHSPQSDEAVWGTDTESRRLEAAARRPRDSQGYRRHLSAVAPHPETTEADLFAPFAKADRR